MNYEAIRIVLDKLYAHVDQPVEFAADVWWRLYGMNTEPLTSGR